MEIILTLEISAPMLSFAINKAGRAFLILPQSISVTTVSLPGNLAITMPSVIGSLWKNGAGI